MFAKICSIAILVQAISGQYINGYAGYPNTLAAEALANTYSIPNPLYEHHVGGNAVSNGGTFIVKSSSPLTPKGVSVQSDNLLIEGPLAVSGQMPFLGVVSLEGPLPAAGHGAVSYNCGNGNVGIVSENEGIGNGYVNGIANSGIPNAGYVNAGVQNVGYLNTVIPNSGYVSNGIQNAGFANAGIPNTGYVNAGIQNPAYTNAGIPNAAYVNAGIANAGIANAGIGNVAARVY